MKYRDLEILKYTYKTGFTPAFEAHYIQCNSDLLKMGLLEGITGKTMLSRYMNYQEELTFYVLTPAGTLLASSLT